MNPKTTQNWNPTRTQKLPKLGINWVQLGSNRVPLGSPERVPLGSSWVPFGFQLGSIEEKTQIVPYTKCERMSKLTQLDPYRVIWKGHQYWVILSIK